VEVALAGNPEEVKMFFILIAGDVLLLTEPCSAAYAVKQRGIM
jgi:hypothetical protein